MRAAWLLSALTLAAAPAAAEQWSAIPMDDAAYIAASVSFPGLGMSLNCHVRAPEQASVMESIWFESTIAPEGQFVLSFSEVVIPTGPDVGLRVLRRDDIILFVDEAGYRLPPIQWNEMEGGWETFIGAQDRLFLALLSANRLVLQVGTLQAWELPVAGIGLAVNEARAHCASAGRTAPSEQPGAFALPANIKMHVDQQCQGPAVIAPNALQAGDLDGDGIPDVVLDWRGVTCPGQTLNMFCGAANCSITVFMSSRGYGEPMEMLGTSVGIGPVGNGRLGLAISGTYGLCGENGCDKPWVWNGTTLVQHP